MCTTAEMDGHVSKSSKKKYCQKYKPIPIKLDSLKDLGEEASTVPGPSYAMNIMEIKVEYLVPALRSHLSTFSIVITC